jgi:hypothetical protein
MAAIWAVFTFGGSGPVLTAHGSLALKQEIQIQFRPVIPFHYDGPLIYIRRHPLTLLLTQCVCAIEEEIQALSLDLCPRIFITQSRTSILLCCSSKSSCAAKSL